MLSMQKSTLMRDELCNQITFFFYTRPLDDSKPLNYNVLFRRLNEEGLKISRPTLSLHLRHLVSDGVLKRTEISRKNVTYELFTPNIRRVVDKNPDFKLFESFIRKVYSDYPASTLDEKIEYLKVFSLFDVFYELRADVIDIVDPRKRYDFRTDADYFKNVRRFYAERVLDEVREQGNEFGIKIILDMEKFLKNQII